MTDSETPCRFGDSRVLEECHELVKQIKSKKKLKPIKKNKFKLVSRSHVSRQKTHNQKDSLKTQTNDQLVQKSYFQVPKLENQFALNLQRKEINRKKFQEELALPYFKKNTFSSALRSNLLARVHVEDPGALKEPEEIEDVDFEFFSTIKHKIPKNKVDIRSYVDINRSILSTKISTGYFYDEANFIKEKFLDEKSILNDYMKKFQFYFQTLENYMAGKHAESMKLLRLSVIETNETEKKREEVKRLESKLNKIKLSIIELEDQWKNNRMYQDFLFQISPISWRKENDIHYDPQAENPFLREPSAKKAVEPDKYDLIMHGGIDCLDKLMILFLKDFQNINKPVLYFTDPNQVKEIFHELELKNLNSLLHLCELQEPAQIMKLGLEITDKYYNRESYGIAEKLKTIETGVNNETKRKEEIKNKVQSLLQNVLRQLIASKSVLRLQVFIEDVYETVVGPVDWRMSALDMMKAIENKIEEKLMLLDSYSPRVVADATKREQKATQLAMKKALEARRKVMDLDLLLQAMRRLLRRVCVAPKRRMMFRSRLPQIVLGPAPIKEKVGTDQEADSYFFTKSPEDCPSFNSLSKVNGFN